jgi:hypothetical protein
MGDHMPMTAAYEQPPRSIAALEDQARALEQIVQQLAQLNDMLDRLTTHTHVGGRALVVRQR